MRVRPRAATKGRLQGNLFSDPRNTRKDLPCCSNMTLLALNFQALRQQFLGSRPLFSRLVYLKMWQLVAMSESGSQGARRRKKYSIPNGAACPDLLYICGKLDIVISPNLASDALFLVIWASYGEVDLYITRALSNQALANPKIGLLKCRFRMWWHNYLCCFLYTTDHSSNQSLWCGEHFIQTDAFELDLAHLTAVFPDMTKA